MSDRDAIEAGAQALYNMHPEEYRKPISERHDGDAEHTEAAAVYFAVQDIIRADEQSAFIWCDCSVACLAKRGVQAEVRESIVEAIEADRDALTAKIDEAQARGSLIPLGAVEQIDQWATERVAMNRAAAIAGRVT